MLILFNNNIEYLHGSKVINNELGYFQSSRDCCIHLLPSVTFLHYIIVKYLSTFVD